MSNSFNWITLEGLTPYALMLKRMEDKVEEIISGLPQNTIFLLEHEDTYTAGSGNARNDASYINSIPLIRTNRGGKLTYHGKGQRIIYPVINLATSTCGKDIGLYVRNLERWIILSLKELGVNAYAIKGSVGIWVKAGRKDAKIASIGVKIKKWVAYHGISVNISTNLDKFNDIIACGIKDIKHTSLNNLGVFVSLNEFDDVLKKQFRNVEF